MLETVIAITRPGHQKPSYATDHNYIYVAGTTILLFVYLPTV
jgi:hypothetical protein